MTTPTEATPSRGTTLDEKLQALTAEVAKLKEENAQLKHNVEVYRRMAFGPSSEKRGPSSAEVVHPHQGNLFYVDLVAEAFETAARKNLAGAVHADAPRKPRKGGGRKKLPDHLPSFTSRYELPEGRRTCSCGCELHAMGVETSKELERVEMTFVHIIERQKYACRACGEGVVTAEGPDRPFEKSLLGVGFLSYLINERFGNHMPYHRIEKKHAKEGVDISRSVLERSVARCAKRLEPLYDLLRDKVLSSDVLFTDDTPVTIAQPADRAQGSKKGRMWIYLDREGHHAYDFTDSRSADGPRAWLSDYEGLVHADAYPGYNEFFLPDGATEVACWAHTRRKFIDAETTEPELAAEILSRIRELYAIERDARDRELSDDDRQQLRQEKAPPILDDLRARLAVIEATALPKSPLGKAVAYAQRQWTALTIYVTDGRLSIDNNAAERALRDIAIGRNNWTFFMTEGGGKTAAIIYSLLRTAVAAGVNPIDYFRDVLVRIDRERDWTKLLPHAWKEHFEPEIQDRRAAVLQQIAGS